MDNNIKLRVKAGILALSIATGSILATIPATQAEEITYKKGTFITSEEDDEYARYVVKKGDNLSKISEKICRHFKEKVSTKYWPVLAFLNDFPKTLQPGDIVIFPRRFEDLELLLNDLTESKWVSNYTKYNHIYSLRKVDNQITINELLTEIYGKEYASDPEFVKKFLDIQGFSDYNSDTVIEGNSLLFKLTDWIPSYEDLGYQKTKKK